MIRRNKYGAKKAHCNLGHTHDSRKEARWCNDLHLLAKAGAISDLVTHPQFWFVIDGKQVKHRNGRRVGYQADFAFVENGRQVVVDAKGFSVRDWPLRRAIFEALFPDHELREV
jgi:hypothetical protein